MNKGFAPVVVIVFIALAALSVVLIKNRLSVSEATPGPTNSPSPSVIPTPSPTFTPTPTRRAVATPRNSASPTAVGSSCSKYNPEGGLTGIKITLKEKDGKPLVGDWTVSIKPSGNCPGILPPMWGSEIREVIRQPNYTYTSPNMHPGQFRVDVNYHTTGEGFDWEGTSGAHTREITVSN